MRYKQYFVVTMKDSALKEFGLEIVDSYNLGNDKEYLIKPITKCIALFKSPGDNVSVDGEGNFCGWYSNEYLKNAEVLATYVIEPPNPMELYFKGFKHIKEKIIKKKYERLEIVSFYNIRSFILEDENDDLAIDIFFKESYEELGVFEATNKAFEMRKKELKEGRLNNDSTEQQAQAQIIEKVAIDENITKELHELNKTLKEILREMRKRKV